MRGSSSRFSSAFIVPSWQLLIRFKQPRHCLLSLLASFPGAEEIVSVTEPLPGQVLRGPLISIGLCCPLVALTLSASAAVAISSVSPPRTPVTGTHLPGRHTYRAAVLPFVSPASLLPSCPRL